MTDPNHCWTCGKPRRLAPVRGSWGLSLTPLVPRTGDPSHRPAQQTNDLICSVSIYRNGGTNESTHLCDDCLGVGLRALKVRIDDLLGEIDAEHDKDAVIADLMQRLGSLQLRLSNVRFDHNRMQQRLAAILPAEAADESEPIHYARWEVSRGPAKCEL